MRALVVDPAAYTPPYDHALAGGLARAGAEVELVTSHFPHGPVPDGIGAGYRVNEFFYRRSSTFGPRARRAGRIAEHVPGMLRFRSLAATADVIHYQWLPIPRLDLHLLAPTRPRLYTMHWRLPPTDSPIAGVLRRLLARMDAVIVHSEHGRARLIADFGVPPGRLEVIPHGAFDYLTAQPDERPLPAELAAVSGPVILCFGLIRPYKGIDVLLEAFREVEGAELWVVGAPFMPTGPLHELAAKAPGRVRFIERFITDPEIPAYFRRADLVALPYLNIEQSGVLHTALAFGRPMVLSDVGGFGEVAALGAGRLVPPADSRALGAAISELLADPEARARMARSAAAAAEGEHSWDSIGERTVALYERLLTSAAR